MSIKKGTLKKNRKTLLLLILFFVVVSTIIVWEYNIDKESYLSAVDELHMSMSKTNEILEKAISAAGKESFKEEMIQLSYWVGRTQTSFNYLIAESRDYWLYEESKLTYLQNHLVGILKCLEYSKQWNNQKKVKKLKLFRNHLDWLINYEHDALFRALKNSDQDALNSIINKWDEYRYQKLTPSGKSVCY